MPVRLRLLDRVTWDDAPVPGAPAATLLAVLAAHPHGLSDERIVDAVWTDATPATPTAPLQVVVSRLRALDRSLVVRHDGGYQLGLGAQEVDAWWLNDRVATARARLRAGDPAGAVESARQALRCRVGDRGVGGALGELRDRSTVDLRAAERALALGLDRCGRRQESLARLLTPHE